MEIPRKTRYPVHGRIQVALADRRVLLGRTHDIGEDGICVLLDEQLPAGSTFPLCFELFVNGRNNVVTATGRLIYCVFASHGGLRLGFQFVNDDANRTRMIRALSATKPGAQGGAK